MHGLLVDTKREFLVGTDLLQEHHAIQTANPTDSGGQNSTEKAITGFSKAYSDQISSHR